jgi:hypothetical protein
MGKATFIRKLDGWTGDARLYRCDPPMQYREYWGVEATKPAEFVVVSGTHVPYSGTETYIFPATADGEVADWGELEGSFRGGIDHERALEGAGYSVAEVA